MRKAFLVGAGGMGKAWARNLNSHPDISIEAWVDVRSKAAEEAAEELKIDVPHTELSLSEALKLPEIDFVVDVSVPEAHCSVTLAALAAGKPILGEKPMAVSMEEAKRMVAAAESTGKLYMVSQSRRYDAGLAAFRGLIHNELGEVGMVNADFFLGAHFGGFREQMAHVLLLDMAIHTFDQARAIVGQDPVSVYAEEYNPQWSWYEGAACADASFELTEKVRFNYRGSWCAGGFPTSWQANWRVVGRRGTALWDGESSVQAEIEQADSVGFIRDVVGHTAQPTEIATGIRGSLNDFLRALDTGWSPPGECHDNIKSLAMVFAAIESSEMGCRVPVRWN